MHDTIRHSMRAVFFDLDGTLVDSRKGVVHAVASGIRQCFNAHSIEMSPPSEASIMGALGLPASEYFRSLLPPDLLHLADDALARSTAFEVGALANGQGRLFDGTTDALRRIRSSGRAVGIVSNAQKGYFEAALEHLGLGRIANFSLCHDDLPPNERADGKPALLRRGLEGLGLDGHAAAMVGDRADDFRAARACGCPSFGVRCGFGTPAELAEAEVVFEDVAAFAAWLLDQPSAP